MAAGDVNELKNQINEWIIDSESRSSDVFRMENGLRTAGRPECDPLSACVLCSSNPVSTLVAASIWVHAVVSSP